MMSPRDDPFRVLMLCPQFRPLVGGYERAAERLSGALARSGMSVVVVTERRDRAWPAVERFDGFEIRRLACSVRYKLHSVTSLLAIAGYLLRCGRRFDIWHIHQYGRHAALAAVLGKVLGCPVVLKLTSSAGMGVGNTVGTGFAGRLLGFFHRRVSACFASTEETRDEAIRFGIPAENVHLVPNGVDGIQFKPATPAERRAARSVLGLECKHLVLSVARLSSEKNPLGLLDAWAALDNESRRGSLLALVGDGPQWSMAQAKVRALNLEGSVYLARERSDVVTWYRAADFLVISSCNEGLSNTMIEALACGLPIISTRVSGSSILTEDPACGMLVDTQDSMQLTGAIGTLLRNEALRSRMARNARPRFESRFSVDQVSANVRSLYLKLRDRRVRRSAA